MPPPKLISFAESGGDWNQYEAALHQVFLAEIAHAGLTLDRWRIGCRRIPESFGRWASFWHLIQEGKVEDERTPDLRRCERLRWIPWIIVNSATDPEITRWENTRGAETNVLLWYREEYLVVLAKRADYFLLKTAYCTTQSGRIAKLKKEREEYQRRSGFTSRNS